jgi:adenine phosphoribosyltransferase
LIDTRTSGNRYDVTPLFSNPKAFNNLVEDLLDQLGDVEIDLVGCIDALGFILGTAIAQKLNCGVLAIRKGGKLPVETDGVEFKDYTGLKKQLEIRQDILFPEMKVLIVDEWIETGAQVAASIQLIETQGAQVAGILTIAMDENESTRQIKSNYRVIVAWKDNP